MMLIVMAAGTFDVQAQPSGYSYYKTVTVNAAQVSGTQTNFPVLVSFSDSNLRSVANGGNVQSSSGYDIVFTNFDGSSTLDHQIESYDPTTGTLVAWVRVPSLSGTVNTDLRLYYGNSSVSSSQSSAATWSSDFMAVYHFNNTVNDATANTNNLTDNSTGTLNTGKIGAARDLNNSTNIASNQAGQYLQMPNGMFSGVGNFTFSGWVLMDRVDTNWERVFDFGQNNTSYFFFTTSSGTGNPSDTRARITTSGGGGEQGPIITNTTAALGQWVHWAVVLDDAANSITVYRNGVLYGSATNVTLNLNSLEPSSANYLGRSNYDADNLIDAKFDEIRLAQTNLSAGWITTEYNNQNSPGTFLSIGAQVEATPPVLQSAVIDTTTLILTYNEVLNAGSTPATTDFNVTVNGGSTTVSTVAVSGSEVTLTLSSAVSYGDAVVINYTEGTNPIEDAAGNDAAALTGQSVTNNTSALVLPVPPVEISATAVAGGNIDVVFSDVSNSVGIVSYNVKRATSQGGPYTTIGTVTDNESSYYTYTDNTVTSGTTYYYVVTSVDTNTDESAESEEVNATADADAPTLISASINGEELVIDFSELLNTSSVPATGDFTVRVNGTPVSVTEVIISGSRVILAVDPEVIAADNVEVDYTIGSNPVQDEAGNNASAFSNQSVQNITFNANIYGPDPCPIVNDQDASWACFSGVNNGTSMTASVGGLVIATVDAASGSQTTFAPNALQLWASGAFSGDEFNGPQVNPTGNSGNATSLDINIPSDVRSDAMILSLNRLRPDAGATTYTLEAFDGLNQKVTVNDWLTGQGTDGGVCTNAVTLAYTNGNTTIEFQPMVSGSSSCSSSSTPVWFRITDSDVERIEIRKTSSNPDNIHIGLALVADFGDAPLSYGTKYSGVSLPPAFHLLSNTGTNPVYFGFGVDGDGNGYAGSTSTGDDTETGSLGSGDDEDAISVLPEINTAETSYSVDLICTDGAYAAGWIDFDISGTFDASEYAYGLCSSGVVTLNWSGISGLVTGNTYARFRIASQLSDVSYPIGSAADGEVEDYPLTIIPPPMPDMDIAKTVDQSNPNEGDNVTFTITVTNPGDYIATGLKVTDILPTGLTYVSSTASQGSYSAGTGIWNIGTMPATGDSASVTLDIVASVNSGTLGSTLTNTASISSLVESDPDLGNNSASAGVTVVPESADIAITKIVSNANPIEGEYITYTISVTNNGPKTATNLKILDQLPTGITYIDSTVSVGNYNPTSGIWTIGTLANGSSASLIIDVRVDDFTEGTTISNSATLSSMDQVDPVSSNNTSTAPLTVALPSNNLSCGLPYLKFQNPVLLSGTALQVGAIYRFDTVLPGVYAKVEILTNNNAILKNIDDDATSGLPNDFSPFIENATGADAYIDFEISFFDSVNNLSRFLSFSATTSDVDGTGNLRDFVGYQNLSSFVVESTTNLIAGSEGIYSTFVSSDFNNTYPGQPDYTDYKVYAAYTNEPKFRLRAGIKSNGDIDDRIISVNFDPCELNTFADPVSQNVVDIAVTKTVDDNSVTTGQTITYTIQASNEKANAVGSIEVTDQLPAGLTYVSSNPSQGSYNNTTGVWSVGSLSGLQVANLEIVATVNAGTEGNTITNTATLTNTTGVDGLATNNSSSVAISVFDPGSGMTCNEPPLYSFLNYSIEQGVQNQVNSVYRYSNVASGIDALVKIIAINNVTINTFDDDGTNSGGQATATNFSPLFTTNDGVNPGYIDWEIKFVQTGTTTPVRSDFSVTATDIDGTDLGNGVTIVDYYGFAQNVSNTVQAGNNLDPIFTQGDYEIFRSAVTQDANGIFDIDHIAYITYKYTSVFQVRSGSFPTGGYSNPRLVEFNFTQCLNQEFTNPVVTNRNADLAVTKTVDEANPLENETINFSIDVQNNGPEKATEVIVNEALPAGLTLVEATTTQGTYSQITKLWNVGTLNSGATATLDIEATVDANITADSLINKAYVVGFNQFDPIIANDTSSVVIKVSQQIKGTVFEDIKGDGYTEDTNFGDASGDQQALENVEVHLFKDGGDGVADGADDIYVKSDSTSNLGAFVFNIGEDADYWIVVDSKTGELSNGNRWGEQTYAPVGGLCEDGTGATVAKTSAGHCFSGRRGDVSDNISTTPIPSDLANAEHIAKVTMSGSNVSNIDFGFSFNVVTNTNDGDDDATANRSIQGSLDQFIRNANDITGANTMRFVPSVPSNSSGSGGNWWTITLGDALPAITDPLTTVSGIAYNRTSPKTTRNDNSGSVGSGSVVGLDNLSLATFERKELEIDLNDVGATAFVVNTSGAYTIRQIALYNNSNGVVIQNGSGGLIEKNLVGTRADGTNPVSSDRIDLGLLFTGSGSNSTLVQQNYFTNLNNSAIKSTSSLASIEVFNNEIYQVALTDTQADGIEGLGIWTIRQNLIHEVGNTGSLALDGGSGIEIGAASGSTSGSTIRNNAIRLNKVAGITVLNGVTSTLIEKNIINGNGTNYSATSPKKGAGIKLTNPSSASQSGVRITQNSFYANHGISIDIVSGGTGDADGVSPNDGVLQSATTAPNRGLDYPRFTLSTLNNNILHLEGYVGTSTTKLNSTYTIEVYKAENDNDNEGLIEVGGSLIRPHGEGRYYLGSFTTSSDGTFSIDIDVSSIPTSLVFNDRITAIAIGTANNTSEFSANQRVVPTGVTISGYVYHDTNHNMIKDSGESGLTGVTMVLYNTQENNCKSVLTDANGLYTFTNVLNGTYDLIESYGQSVPTPDICTPAQTDPDEYISTTPNLRTVTVNNLPAIQNFGDYKGVKITGKVFNDNGISGGTANDALQNGGETGFSTITVQALTAGSTLIEQVSTAADGSYSLYVPETVVSNGGTVKIKEINGSDKISTGGQVGNTGGTYSIATDEFTFTITTGTSYSNVIFADVSVNRFLTDGQQNALPGALALFQHNFVANTSGTIKFTTSTVSNPNNVNWPVILYNDLNCNGAIDSGEPILTANDGVTVNAGDNVCQVLKVNVPYGLNDGATSTTTITATIDFSNTNPVIQQVLQRTDIVTVSTTEAGLVIIKSVDKPQALPGETLSYSINYENLGDEPISQVEIIDETPTFTTYLNSQCGTLPSGITCSITAPQVGAGGTIKWTFTGTLQPGQSGTVTYSVVIDN